MFRRAIDGGQEFRFGSLIVLDSDGDAIMRIEDAGHGESVVTDLRVDPDALLIARETPFPPSEAATPVVDTYF